MAGTKDLQELLRGGLLPSQLDKDSIGVYEEEALKAANSVFSAIEALLAAYDASRDKPAELRKEAERYRMFAQAIGGWERKMLVLRGKKREYSDRLKTLGEFADILSLYGGAW